MKQAQPNKRATREENALRNAQIVYLRATTGATKERIAAKLELSGRQVQRGLSELRKTRPAPRSPKSDELASILGHRYSWLHESVRVLKREALRAGGVRSPAFHSIETLQWEVLREFMVFDRTQLAEQVRRATYDDLWAKGPNDVMARLGRALRIGGADEALELQLQAMLTTFGPQEQIPKVSKGVNRGVRMTLLYIATDLSRAEVGVAFGCSYKTVGRVAKKTVARYPQVGTWAEGIKHALTDFEEQYAALDGACIIGGIKQQDVRPLLELINRRRDTLLLLGALPNPSYGEYLAFRTLLLEGAGAACDRHQVGGECRERVLLILNAWADRKRLPASFAPLPPRHKKLEEMSPFSGVWAPDGFICEA